jgi:hypothetical protein
MFDPAKIHVLGLPAAVFYNAAAWRENRGEARAYDERTVREYAEDRCEVDLWDAFERLGCLPDEIQWHVDHPGGRMRTRAIGRGREISV